MSLRSALVHLGTAAAGGALILGAASIALATGAGDDSDQGGQGRQDGRDAQDRRDGPDGREGRDMGVADGQDSQDPRGFQGVVTAPGGLKLHTAPTRGSAVLRTAAQGEVVQIFCKAPGDTVDGNPLWYLVKDGTWSWGAARHINNIGPSPRWC